MGISGVCPNSIPEILKLCKFFVKNKKNLKYALVDEKLDSHTVFLEQHIYTHANFLRTI